MPAAAGVGQAKSVAGLARRGAGAKAGWATARADATAREQRRHHGNREREGKGSTGRRGWRLMHRARDAERAVLPAVLVLGIVSVVPRRVMRRWCAAATCSLAAAVSRAAMARSKRTVCARTARTANHVTVRRIVGRPMRHRLACPLFTTSDTIGSWGFSRKPRQLTEALEPPRSYQRNARPSARVLMATTQLPTTRTPICAHIGRRRLTAVAQ